MCKGHVVAKSGARSEDEVENEAETRAHGLVGHDQVWGRGRRAGCLKRMRLVVSELQPTSSPSSSSSLSHTPSPDLECSFSPHLPSTAEETEGQKGHARVTLWAGGRVGLQAGTHLSDK